MASCTNTAKLDNLTANNGPLLVLNPGSQSSTLVFSMGSTDNFCSNLTNTAAYIASMYPYGYFAVAVYDTLPACTVYGLDRRLFLTCTNAHETQTSVGPPGPIAVPSSLCVVGNNTTFPVVSNSGTTQSTVFMQGFDGTPACAANVQAIINLVNEYFSYQPCFCTDPVAGGGCGHPGSSYSCP